MISSGRRTKAGGSLSSRPWSASGMMMGFFSIDGRLPSPTSATTPVTTSGSVILDDKPGAECDHGSRLSSQRIYHGPATWLAIGENLVLRDGIGGRGREHEGRIGWMAGWMDGME